MPRYNVGAYTRKRKQMEERQISSSSKIMGIQTEIAKQEDILTKRKHCHVLEERLRKLDAKVETLVSQVEAVEDIDKELTQTDRGSRSSHLSEKALQNRRKNPTGFEKGKITLKPVSIRQRRKETFLASQEIHGGSEESSVPGSIGIVDTALSKCSPDVLVDVMHVNNKFNKHVMPTIYKRNLKQYESSEENMERSISVYYSGGIAGKQKFRKIYRDSCYKSSANSKNRVRLSIQECPIPRLVPYNKLMPYIKSIPVGNIHSVYNTLCDGLHEFEKVCGCYRSLKEMLVSLAEFYLSGHSGHTLTWFGEEHTFFVTLGGDGAPFGKDDTACAWLVGFLNIGRGILSSNENHLLFGANCSENCIPVQRYIKLLLADIKEIENGIFPIKYKGADGQEVTVNVKFHIAELPNDMKMTAFLSGESSNSAKFFVPNVSTMKAKCHLSRLNKKIVRWFNETGAEGKQFDYRFTGKESKGFLHNFMFLIDAVEPSAQQGSRTHLILHVLAYYCLTLRNCVSLFCQIEITDQQQVELEHNCKTFFTLNYLFFPHHPTVWHLGHIVPAHTKEMSKIWHGYYT